MRSLHCSPLTFATGGFAFRARPWLVLLLLVLTIAPTHAAAPILVAQVIAGGGGTSRSAGDCYQLDATIGQPLAGRSAAGNFVLVAGFWAGRSQTDSLFHQGFEVCR